MALSEGSVCLARQKCMYAYASICVSVLVYTRVGFELH